jgi:serine/tyrosine/threonine adenylyltransferase
MNAPDSLAAVQPAVAAQALAWQPSGWWQRLAAMHPQLGTSLPTQPLPNPQPVAFSDGLATSLGLGSLAQRSDVLQVLAGHPGAGQAMPFASAYSGHQFGVWAGQLGDGRAHSLGELMLPNGTDVAAVCGVPVEAGPCLELQLKGAGLTPYSRMGDGRAVLRSSIREFLASEAMHALGIPTTRALSVVGSALPVRRETLETAAVVARVAPSFLRFGHFEHLTHTLQDVAALRDLTDAAIESFFPALRDVEQPYLALLQAVTKRTATLMAAWQSVGFCHGVMNTDNMSLLGLTIDYGPYGFLDGYDPGHICNHTDQQGRYAYARQPGIGLWNCSALAHALMPLINDMPAVQATLETYKASFATALIARYRAKLGLTREDLQDAQANLETDSQLIDQWLALLAAGRVDFTIAHRCLALGGEPLRDLFLDRDGLDAWQAAYKAQRAPLDAKRDNIAAMQRANPKYILRNHLAQTAITRAEQGDFSETQRLQHLLQHPFDEQPAFEADAALPPDWAQHLEISCSS